jgi:hypothetical protein
MGVPWRSEPNQSAENVRMRVEGFRFVLNRKSMTILVIPVLVTGIQLSTLAVAS